MSIYSVYTRQQIMACQGAHCTLYTACAMSSILVYRVSHNTPGQPLRAVSRVAGVHTHVYIDRYEYEYVYWASPAAP